MNISPLPKVFSNLDIVFSSLHRDYVINEGKNLTIPCGESNYPSVWSRYGSNITNHYSVINVSVGLLSRCN